MNQITEDFERIKHTAWWKWVAEEKEEIVRTAMFRLVSADNMNEVVEEQSKIRSMETFFATISDPDTYFEEDINNE